MSIIRVFPARLGALARSVALGLSLMAGLLQAPASAPALAQDAAEFSRARDAERAAQAQAQRARPAPRPRVRAAARAVAPRAAPGRAVVARALPSRPTPPRPVQARREQSRPEQPRAVSASARAARGTAGVPTALPEGPLLLVVSLEKQRLSVYSKGKLAETTVVSTGTSADPTPSGVFAVIEKHEKHFSNLFGGAPMPFMQRLTMSGVALHAGHVTGRPASHGCIRLPHEYARHLFKATPLGVRVVVSADDPEPVEIADMRLLEPARVASATKLAAAQTTDDATGTVTDSGSSPPTPAARDMSIDLRTGRPKGPLAWQRDEVLRAAPVSILVSRAEARVYVRHMFEPQTDAEIAISEPRRPLGTHVYTLTDVQPDGSGQRWSAVTVKLVPRRAAAVRVLSGNRSRASRALGPAPSTGPQDEGTPSTAAEAVQRFALPPAIVAQVAPLLRPGMSLVVTDQAPSRRIQSGWTDIIVTP